MLKAACAGPNSLSHVLGHSRATRNVLVIRIVYGHGLDVLHLDSTHVRWQSDVPLALQRVVDPHSPLWAWSADKGHLGEL